MNVKTLFSSKTFNLATRGSERTWWNIDEGIVDVGVCKVEQERQKEGMEGRSKLKEEWRGRRRKSDRGEENERKKKQ